MELNFELTSRSKILLGILGCLVLVAVILQGAPIFYRLFSNQDTKAKQEALRKTEHLVHAAEVLKPAEFEIYKATGLAPAANPQMNTPTQGATTLFDTESPETVIRARIDALVRQADIQQNYQLLTKPGTTKQTQKLTMQTRENLVRYLYFKTYRDRRNRTHRNCRSGNRRQELQPSDGCMALRNGNRRKNGKS